MPVESPQNAGDDFGTSGAENRAQPKSEIGYFTMTKSRTADGRVMVGDSIEIFPDKPRPEFASPETQAFEAKDQRATGKQFALLCRNSRVPRVTCISSYKNFQSPHVVKLLKAGIIDWKPEDRQKLALVFQEPGGRKIIEDPQAQPHAFHDDRIIPGFIQPILSVLNEFRNIDMAHGALSLDNMYLTGQYGAESVVVGECLSTAAFFSLNPAYVTIERGMAQVTGGGPGGAPDDLYALGICVAMLLRGVNLTVNRTRLQIVQEKMEVGSFQFATGGERLPAGISDFLRGVLNDDESQRWTLDDAMRWAEGRRITAKQQYIAVRAARPFLFRDDKYWDLRSLSLSFSLHVREAAATIEKGQFLQWVQRNFDDNDVVKRLDFVLDKEQGAGEDRLVSSVCMALDPLAPLRYKGLAVMPTGFGVALAEAISRQDDIQSYGEIIAGQMFSVWINQRFDDLQDASSLVSTFEKCRNFLLQKMPVYGIERVLYTIDKESVCMSPLLRNYVVLGPGNLLMALEEISRKGNRPQNILDRHMMAFISVREPKMIDPHLGHIISRDRSLQLVGIARTLSAIQRRFNTGPVPGVGEWLVSQISPAVERYRDRDLRAELMKRMQKIDAGNIAEILELIDNPALVQDDMQRFVLARREYAGLVRERLGLEQKLKRRGSYGRGTGSQVAMLVSLTLSSLCIAGYLFLRLVVN